MWPEPGEAVSRALHVEQAVEDLYAEALRRWTPTVAPSVLPALTAGGVNNGIVAATLPPDPAAADTQTASQQWSVTAETVIVTGIALLWAVAVYEALTGLGLPLPDLPDRDYQKLSDIDRPTMRIVTRSTTLTETQVVEAYERIDHDAAYRQARDDYVQTERDKAARAPAQVRDRLTLAVAKAEKAAPETADPITVRREAAEAVLAAGGSDMREIARAAGHDSGAVQNHAVVTAAAANDSDDDPLDKVWIATVDSRTRDTHWAADGQRAPLAGTFTVGGEALRYPQDPAGSPAETARCRCRVGILGRDEPLPSDVDRHTERLDGRDATAQRREGSQEDEIDRREQRGNVRARDDDRGLGRTASAAPSEQEYAVADDDNEGTEMFRTFTDAVFALVGEPTSDGRMLAVDIDLRPRTFPQPLMWCKQTGYGHEDAYTVGVVEEARYDKKAGKVLGSGYMLNTSEAEEAANEIAHGVTSPSVDLADSEWLATDRDGNEIDYDEYVESIENGDPIKVYSTVTSAELIGCTLVATAAFGDTQLTLNPEREARDVALVAAIVASAGQAYKPPVFSAALVAPVPLDGPTPLSYDAQTGRVFGHLACFGVCHRSVQAECIQPPRTHSDYGYFHTSPPVTLDDGTTAQLGRLTVGTGHAPTDRRTSGAMAQAHYDNTGTAWALVRAYEDEHGIAVTGFRAPWVSDEKFQEGLMSPLSGDWRDYDGRGMELTAALSVNTPGFVVRGSQNDVGRQVSLVACLSPFAADQPNPATGVPTADAKSIAAELHALQKLDAQRTAVLARAKDRPDLPPEPAPPTLDDLVARARQTAGRV